MNVDRTDGEWSHVIAADGRSGWMATRYLLATALTGDIATAEGSTTSTRRIPHSHKVRGIAERGDSPGVAGPQDKSSPPTFIVDTAAPAAPKIHGFSPDSGATGDGLTNQAALILIGTAEAGSTVTIRDGETVLGTTPVDSSGKWTFAANALAEGVHSFTAFASDAANNAGAASAPLAVEIDTEPPSVALSAVMDDAKNSIVSPSGWTSDNTPTLSGTAEPGSTVQVILRRAGFPEVMLSPKLNGSEWSVAPNAELPDGPYTVTVIATDKAGNVKAVSGASD